MATWNLNRCRTAALPCASLQPLISPLHTLPTTSTPGLYNCSMLNAFYMITPPMLLNGKLSSSNSASHLMPTSPSHSPLKKHPPTVLLHMQLAASCIRITLSSLRPPKFANEHSSFSKGYRPMQVERFLSLSPENKWLHTLTASYPLSLATAQCNLKAPPCPPCSSRAWMGTTPC